ncbi:hypothetical protein GCM10008959_18050 [Deinococcus seoulensis]|uniref:Uncharacterized protein n=1 Tax=Deinococcus seoulensis TaxID=1837379 RepID=A0ABQ2RTU5_9DEIO|nr:hypothetical protein GCM10008959_18050 [Deinococcus seoulensis]
MRRTELRGTELRGHGQARRRGWWGCALSIAGQGRGIHWGMNESGVTGEGMSGVTLTTLAGATLAGAGRA